MKMFQRLNDPCAPWRAKLEKAYMAGDEETMQKMSRKIDEYQKAFWKENRKTKEISI